MCGTGKEKLKADILLRIKEYRDTCSRKYQKPHSGFEGNSSLPRIILPMIKRMNLLPIYLTTFNDWLLMSKTIRNMKLETPE